MAKIEVKVQEEQKQTPGQGKPGSVQEAVHTLFLAGAGALAIAQDTAASVLHTLAEQGERVQAEGRRMVQGRMESRQHQVRKLVERGRKETERAEGELHTRVETILNRAQVPTKSDIEALSAEISALSAKLDELKKGQP